MNIPVINISSFLSGNNADSASAPSVVDAVRSAAINPGFFQIVGHDISPSRADQFFNALRTFFGQPTEVKQAITQELSVSPRGYEPLGAQQLEKGVRDLKEGFVWGSEQSPDRQDINPMARGPNKWPASDTMPDFARVQSEMLQFYEDVFILGQAVLRILALGLGLSEDYFQPLVEGDGAIVTCRAHRYMPRREEETIPGTRGVGAHTDFGALTLLMQDDVGGLEVFDRASETWHPVQPVPGALVVNLGDLMARWTNEKYASTLHQVVTPEGEQSRYSVAFFIVGNPDYVIECLPVCKEEGEEPKYKPVTVGEHLMNRVRETYSR